MVRCAQLRAALSARTLGTIKGESPGVRNPVSLTNLGMDPKIMLELGYYYIVLRP